MGAPGPKPRPTPWGYEVEPRTEPLVPPRKLGDAQQKIWDQFIAPAWWLRETDSMLALLLCDTFAQYLRRPKEMPASTLTEMRRQMSELGLTSSEATRAD